MGLHQNTILGNNKPNKSKNNYITRTRKLHTCRYCEGIIPIGKLVRTVNPRKGSRFWVCPTCDSLLGNIMKAKYRLDNVAFDDEGAAWAFDEGLREVIAEFTERCTDEDINDKLWKIIEH